MGFPSSCLKRICPNNSTVCQEKIIVSDKDSLSHAIFSPENRIFLSRGVFASKKNDEHYNSFHHQPKERKLAKIL
jgi:hypothetical protein